MRKQHDTLAEIALVLSGVEWSSDELETIAQILIREGYTINPPEPTPTPGSDASRAFHSGPHRPAMLDGEGGRA